MGTNKNNNRDGCLENIAQWPLIIWIIFSAFTCTSGSLYLQIITILMSTFLTFMIIKEHWRRRKEGYYVEMWPLGPDDGQITYIEGAHRINLLVDFYQKIVFVPSNEKWQEIVPDWAKNRREEIIDRVKKRIKGREYKEDDHIYRYDTPNLK